MIVHLQQRQEFIRGRREKRKTARLARLRRQILRYTCLTLLVGVGAAGMTQLPWCISNLDADIELHGNVVVADNQIKQTLRNCLGKPLYRLDPSVLEKDVTALPAVRYAFVRRYLLPHPKLKVEVLEEFPWATFYNAPDEPSQAVISQSGRFIPVDEFPAVVQPKLHICGNPGMKLTAAQIANWNSWTAFISEQTGEQIALVDLRCPTAIKVSCPNIELHLGAADSSLTKRLGRLASVMPLTATLKNKLSYIDLSLDSNVPLKIARMDSSTRQVEAKSQDQADESGQQPNPQSAQL